RSHGRGGVEGDRVGGDPPNRLSTRRTTLGGSPAALGSEAADAPELAEADAGRWRGLPYAEVAETDPDGLAAWLGDPRAAPHGGESLARLAARVSGWLDAAAAEAVVICDVGVIRAALGHALGLGPLETARFDVAPLSTTELVPVRGGWRVAHVNRKVIT
ncbi:histidine phosphatase family protein, partial [Streptosporangium sandarakinum]